MKKLIIPEKVEAFINIAEIDGNFKGLAIGYKNEKSVGYFQYEKNYATWYFMLSTNTLEVDPNVQNENLLTAVKIGLKDGVFDEVRVIEFEN